MTLDTLNLIDPMMQSTPEGGVTLVTQIEGGYTGPGGTWEPGAETETDLGLVTIQQADMRTARQFADLGGVANPSDLRVVYINDGTMLYLDDAGTFAQILRFSDGNKIRDWRVREADNRPWRFYCKAIVERYRGNG